MAARPDRNLLTAADCPGPRASGEMPQGDAAELMRSLQLWLTDQATPWRLGQANADALGRVALDHVLSTYAAGLEPPDQDVQREAWASHICCGDPKSTGAFVAYWKEKAGLPFLLNLLAARPGAQVNTQGPPLQRWLVEADPSSASRYEYFEYALAEALRRASPAQRSEALQEGKRLRAEHSLSLRVTLTEICQEPEWAVADATALLEQNGDVPRAAGMLLYLLAEPGQIDAFGARMIQHIIPSRLLASAGFAGVPLVVRKLQQDLDEYVDIKLDFALLAKIESEAAARFIAKVGHSRGLRAIAKEYFERRPDLASAVGWVAEAPKQAASRPKTPRRSSA